MSNSVCMPQSTTLCGNRKTSDSSQTEQTQQKTKRSNKKSKLEETNILIEIVESTKFCFLGEKLGKRCKNWSEGETKMFIATWSQNYLRVMSGGSRSAAIYQAMADELNKTFTGHSRTGSEVKAKIGNLITEYRRKKKKLGRTGGSPPTWPYYELVDKILGKVSSLRFNVNLSL